MAPKELLAPCMTIEPIAVIEYCNPIGSPIPSKFLTMDNVDPVSRTLNKKALKND